MYSDKFWDTESADIILNSERKIENKEHSRVTGTEKAMLFPGWDNIPILCYVIMK